MTALRQLPDLAPNRAVEVAPSHERRLSNGLTVIAIRRPSVPLIELRLRVPFARTEIDSSFLAGSVVLGQTLFAGTEKMSIVEIDESLQAVGGDLSATVDSDRLLVSGGCLADGLDQALTILADVLEHANYPAHEVETERARLVDRIQVALSQPAHLARVALLRRIYGEHPYALQTPSVDDVAAVDPAQLSTLHAQRLRPDGGFLVIAGDVEPDRLFELAQHRLGTWTGAGPVELTPPTPPIAGGPIRLVDRPGSVQSSLRLAMGGVGRTHPDFAPLVLANMIAGGYFSSRWVENIREQKGYSYGPHAAIEHSLAGSTVVWSAEVATEVTAPALAETWYELSRIATLPPSQAELDQARQYVLGSLLLGAATQSGLAGLASTYAGFGLRLDFLAEYAAKLAAVDLDDVARAAAQYLAPANTAVVVLGDASAIESGLAVLAPIERL